MTAERFRIRAIPHRIRGATGRPGRDGADPGTALTGAELIVAPVRHARSGPGVDDAPESDASARLLGEEGWQAVQRVGIWGHPVQPQKVRVAPVSPSPLPSLLPPVAFAFFASFACLRSGFCAAGEGGSEHPVSVSEYGLHRVKERIGCFGGTMNVRPGRWPGEVNSPAKLDSSRRPGRPAPSCFEFAKSTPGCG